MLLVIPTNCQLFLDTPLPHVSKYYLLVDPSPPPSHTQNPHRKGCLDSRLLCLPVEQEGFPPCSLVRGNALIPVKQSRSLLAIQEAYLPFTGGSAMPALWCNARCLILDFKVLFQMDMISYFLTSQKIRPSNLMFNGQKENQYWVFLYLVIVISFGSCRNPFHIWFLFD